MIEGIVGHGQPRRWRGSADGGVDMPCPYEGSEEDGTHICVPYEIASSRLGGTRNDGGSGLSDRRMGAT